MAEIDVTVAEAADGWMAEVRVRDGGRETRHRVRVPRATAERLAPGVDPTALVGASFEFLLEREPKDSILREFEIGLIGGYFPESTSRRCGAGSGRS